MNEGGMVQRVSTVAFEGIEARAVDVQVVPGAIASGPIELFQYASAHQTQRPRDRS
jgi:hypothetical protein